MQQAVQPASRSGGVSIQASAGLARYIQMVFPFLGWLKDLNLNALRVDFLSGLTVALILIPQSMAYAQLAGMPVHYGLYASLFPPMLAALFGSSRQLATGPVAIVSLMTSAALSPLATAGSDAFISYAILLALIVGVFQFSLGVLRLGLVVNFLSHPVVNGFTNAGALIIATSQLSKMFNVYVDEAEHHYETVFRVIKAAIAHTHWPTLALGVLAFVLMYGLRRIDRRIPYVLVAVVTHLLGNGLRAQCPGPRERHHASGDAKADRRIQCRGDGNRDPFGRAGRSEFQDLRSRRSLWGPFHPGP